MFVAAIRCDGCGATVAAHTSEMNWIDVVDVTVVELGWAQVRTREGWQNLCPTCANSD